MERGTSGREVEGGRWRGEEGEEGMAAASSSRSRKGEEAAWKSGSDYSKCRANLWVVLVIHTPDWWTLSAPGYAPHLIIRSRQISACRIIEDTELSLSQRDLRPHDARERGVCEAVWRRNSININSR